MNCLLLPGNMDLLWFCVCFFFFFSLYMAAAAVDVLKQDDRWSVIVSSNIPGSPTGCISSLA